MNTILGWETNRGRWTIAIWLSPCGTQMCLAGRNPPILFIKTYRSYLLFAKGAPTAFFWTTLIAATLTSVRNERTHTRLAQSAATGIITLCMVRRRNGVAGISRD